MTEKYKVVRLNKENRAFLSEKIKQLEKDIYYPLGDDYFKIDHGEDYFAFFERLGEIEYCCVFDNDNLIGVGCAVVRIINGQQALYLCDLKVKNEYRNKGVSEILFRRGFLYVLLNKRIFRAYAVVMDSSDKRNLAYKKIKKVSHGLLKKNNQQNIYSLNKSNVSNYCNLFEKYNIVHTQGKKDLILKSTNMKLALFHLVKANRVESNVLLKDIPDDGVIMISTRDGDELDKKLRERFSYTSTASVLTFRINDNFDVFTDEI